MLITVFSTTLFIVVLFDENGNDRQHSCFQQGETGLRERSALQRGYG